MKLSEIRPCDNCGGNLQPIFYLVDTTLAILDHQAINQVIGMTHYMQGHLQLAEMFSPKPDVVTIAGDKDPNLRTRLFLCQDCYMMQGVNLAKLSEDVTTEDKESG